MNDSLRDVISIAAEGGARRSGGQDTRNVAQFRTVGVEAAVNKASPASSIATQQATRRPEPDIPALGGAGLRMAFWLCGFHEALLERQKTGESLTQREQSLLTLSRADFVEIRPAVVGAALLRLDGVCNDRTLLTEVNDPRVEQARNQQAEAVPIELFALETVRNLARRARETLETDGPDAALSLFGGGSSLQEPLAIFQSVFSAVLGLVESFERLTPDGTGLLARLADALDTEVSRV